MIPNIEEVKKLNSEAKIDEPVKLERKKKCKSLPWLTWIAVILLVVCLVPIEHLRIVTDFRRSVRQVYDDLIEFSAISIVEEVDQDQLPDVSILLYHILRMH